MALEFSSNSFTHFVVTIRNDETDDEGQQVEPQVWDDIDYLEFEGPWLVMHQRAQDATDKHTHVAVNCPAGTGVHWIVVKNESNQ